MCWGKRATYPVFGVQLPLHGEHLRLPGLHLSLVRLPGSLQCFQPGQKGVQTPGTGDVCFALWVLSCHNRDNLIGRSWRMP